MVFWRLKCHACGSRSQYSKGSSTTRFQCTECQTWNFVDSNGDYVDPPTSFVQQQALQQRSLKNAALSTGMTQQNIFCQTCLRNQQIYHDLLSNYLPDEDDPTYSKYEKALPAYKLDLEKRYPQICKECAPKAQSMIHEADYYSMTNNASRLVEQSRGGRRSLSPPAVTSRDSVTKMLARIGLTIVGWAVFLSAAYQILWHALSIMQIKQELLPGGRLNVTDEAALIVELGTPAPKASQCLEELSRLHFSYGCCSQAGRFISQALVVSLCLLWYNQGLKKLYSPSTRFASVKGWRQHLVISSFILFMRWLAFTMLSDFKLNLTYLQILAAHTVMIILIVVGNVLARRTIYTERWKVSGSIMPRPEDRDMLSQYAGPAAEKHVPRASLIPARALLSTEYKSTFPVENLSERRSHSRPSTTTDSIEISASYTEIDDPMDIEPVPPASVPSPLGFHSSNFARSTGWESVRTNLFSIEDEARAKQARARQGLDDDKHMYFKPTQPTPFRGRLPQAPMSQERRLRNPISQVPQFKEIPVTQRQDFLQQMRNGIDRGRGFAAQHSSAINDLDEATDPAASRTKGQLDLAPGIWHLEKDINTATGLEDMFSGTFKLNDRPDHHLQTNAVRQVSASPQQWHTAGIAILATMVVMFVLDLAGFRREVCLFFVRRLEALGY